MSSDLILSIQKLSERIKNYCKPLEDYLGLPLFHYYRVFPEDGTFINIANNQSIIENYYSMVNHEILYFKDYLDVQSRYKFILWPDQPSSTGMHVYFNNGYWHGITIKTEEISSIEFFCFLSDINHPKTRDFFVRNIKLFESFITDFKMKFNDSVIKEALLNKAKYRDGCNFIFPESQIIESVDECSFLNAIRAQGYNLDSNGKIIKITPKELQCWQLLSQGYTIKGISKSLSIASKTAANHIDSIKNKINCHCKDSLVNFYHELF